MSTLEKFCLKWNDFQENVNTSFAALRTDSDFTDVTLACQDSNQVNAHKVILAASSPFFQNLLKRNQHAHPLIYMRGMNAEDLLAIVDFLYYGQANINQENLDSFLKIAEELEIKGLNGGGGTPKKQTNKPTSPCSRTQQKTETFDTKIAPSLPQPFPENQIPSSTAIALPKKDFSGDLKELDVQIETMIGRGENMVRQGSQRMVKAYVCQVCGKEGQKINIKDHIEAKHLEGISIPCSLCEKTFRSRDGLRHHMRNHNSFHNSTKC
jgi:hypothetical protein